MLVRMGIKYDSEDALQTVDQVMKIFCDTAYETSCDCIQDAGADPQALFTCVVYETLVCLTVATRAFSRRGCLRRASDDGRTSLDAVRPV